MNRILSLKYSPLQTVRRSFGIFLLGILPLVSYTQSNRLDVKYSGSFDQESLEVVLSEITTRTGVKFSYSTNRIPVDSEVTVSFEDEPLSLVLDRLFEGMPIRYELMDEYIILKKGRVDTREKSTREVSKYTLNGFIKDKRSGEFLIGAAVYIPEIEQGTITNKYGYFSLTLPLGKYTLMISYMGYEVFRLDIDLASNMKFDCNLIPSMNLMDEVVISSLKKEELQFKKVASQTEVIPEQIKKLPALFGESDVLKNLELQAGINYNGDGSNYFHVRGGHYDQNLILLDEATLFNPSHMLGIFSPIIPDAVKSVDIYKAGFPAHYGGRLSSVIDIRTRDGNMNKFSASGSIGIISARASIEGPLKKGRSSYFISYRRSYFDIFLKAVSPNINNLFFYDFTSKFNLRMGPRDRLFITLYKGADVFRLKEGNNQLNGLDWSNTSSTIRWNHILGSKTFMNFTVYGSKYDYYLHNDLATGSYWNSLINNVSVKEEISYFASPRFNIRFGAQLGAYDFNPGNFSSAENREMIQVSPVRSAEGAIFAGVEHEVFSWLALHYGLRFSAWLNTGRAFVARYTEDYELEGIDYYLNNQKYYNHSGFEPRLSLSANIAPATYLKFSYSRTIQYINLISNSISPFNSFEVWLPSGPNIRPQMADIYDLGILKSFENQGVDIQADIFYKKLFNQIGYTYHASMLVNPLIEGEIRQGDGWAYGLEFSFQKESGKLNSHFAYTYLRSFLQIDELNGGDVFPTPQDRPHSVNLSLAYQAKERWLITASLNYSSGARITTPTSFYYYQGYQVPLYTEKSNDHLPAYGRMDLASTFRLNKEEDAYNHSLIFAIYNMFGQQNPIFLYYNKTVAEDGSLLVPTDRLNSQELSPSIRYTFIVMPSVTYQFNF